ncbi:MAG: nitroreductase family protein [Acidimicrobiales bacterium]
MGPERQLVEVDYDRGARLLDDVRHRRSVRSFEPGFALDRKALRLICEAARWAPSGANTQPWDLVVVDEPATLRAVAEVFIRQADRLIVHCHSFPHVHKKHWITESVAIILLFADPRWRRAYPITDEPAWAEEYRANTERIWLASIGAAAQNMQLATSALGLSSAWLSGGGETTTAAELRAVLSVPEPLVPVATIPIGWPHRRSESRWRRPLDELVHWNRFDAGRARADADIDFYVTKLRRRAMYRAEERIEEWPGYERPLAEPQGGDDGQMAE